MPRVSSFYGINIYFNYNDHDPPHFHAEYAEFAAAFQIDPFNILEGSLPSRARRLVEEWAMLHKAELIEDWDLRARRMPLNPIAGLE